MLIYIVRHGQSEFNANHGDGCEGIKACDLKLTEKGVTQAKEAGKALKADLKAHGVGRDRIKVLASPYKRAINTAENILNELEISTSELVVDDMLTEQNYGLFTGEENTEANEKKYPEIYKYYKETIDKVGRFYTSMPFGESEFNMVTRAESIVRKLKELSKTKKYKAVVLVTHHNFIRVLLKVLLNANNVWYENENGPSNCSIQKLAISTDIDKNERLHNDCTDMHSSYFGYIHGNKLDKWMV